MPAKKKRKPKYTSGVLCRDQQRNPYTAFVVFVFGAVVRSDCKLDNKGWWRWPKDGVDHKIFTPREWRATYKLAPPRKGQAFKCDVEL